jgi:hypothetical protein
MALDLVGNAQDEGELIHAGGKQSLSGMPGHNTHGQALK